MWVLVPATAALFGLAAAVFGAGLQLVLAGGLIALLLVIAVVDVQCRLVLDRLTYPGLVVGPLFAWLWPGLGVRAALLGGLAALIIFGALALLYRRGMGLGDVKLAALIGLYLGWPQALPALLTAFLLGRAGWCGHPPRRWLAPEHLRLQPRPGGRSDLRTAGRRRAAPIFFRLSYCHGRG